jgi:hypothetical protein
MATTLDAEPHDRRLRIWFGSIAILGGIGELLTFRRVVSSWQWVQFLVVGAAFLALAIGIPRWSRPLKLAAFGLVHVSVLLALWVNNRELAAAGAVFQTFIGFKLILIGGALILPSDPFIALPVLISATLAPTIEWATWPADWHARLAAGEPFGTVVIGVVAIALYVHRTRVSTLQRRLIESEAQRDVIQKVARIALAMKDLSNTPLQTLSTGLAMLDHAPSSKPDQVDRMRRAVLRLGELNQLLAPYSDQIKWSPEDVSLASRDLIASPVDVPRRA